MATNRDKITNEKLARMILAGTIEPCNYCILKGGCYSITGDSKSFCIQNIESWLSQEAEEDKTCGKCKFHKKVEACIGAIDKKCSNPKSESCGTYTMDDCSCDKWEAEGTQKEDNNKTIFIPLPKDEITSKAIETLLLELHKMSARIDKLEKCNRIAEVKEHIEERLKEETKDMVKNKNMRPMTKEDAEELVNKIGLCAEEVRQMNKTADEMFKELGYEKMSDCEYKRIKPDIKGREVCIAIDDCEAIKYIKDKKLNAGIAEWISNKELKAIHKKLEELKNENNKN